MAETEVDQNYAPDFNNDAGLRINDLEERVNNLKEKISLISKNFIILREELEKRIQEIENKDSEIKSSLNSISKTLSNLTQESEKWVRRDEIVLIERMLKDFQPLEFVRKKDFEELIQEKESSEKNKNPKTLKET